MKVRQPLKIEPMEGTTLYSDHRVSTTRQLYTNPHKKQTLLILAKQIVFKHD